MSDRPKRNPFIPAWLDDLNLTANEFRILCHLWRRAGLDGTCYPGGASIRKKCRISDPTLWAALRKLESSGLLDRKKRFRNSNTYRLIVPSSATQNQTVTGSESLKADGGQLPKSEGWQSLKSEGCKGPQSKEPQLRIDLGAADAAPSKESVSSLKRQPNALLDALVSLDGSDLGQVTEPARGKAAKALKQIKAVSPNVTPEEINRRADNYRSAFKGMRISPNALATHWAAMDRGTNNQIESKYGW